MLSGSVVRERAVVLRDQNLVTVALHLLPNQVFHWLRAALNESFLRVFIVDNHWESILSLVLWLVVAIFIDVFSTGRLIKWLEHNRLGFIWVLIERNFVIVLLKTVLAFWNSLFFINKPIPWLLFDGFDHLFGPLPMELLICSFFDFTLTIFPRIIQDIDLFW